MDGRVFSGSATLIIRCSGAYWLEKLRAVDTSGHAKAKEFCSAFVAKSILGSCLSWVSSCLVSSSTTKLAWTKALLGNLLCARLVRAGQPLQNRPRLAISNDQYFRRPAGMSILTCASDCWTSIFAAVTYWFPGPKSLSTFGTLWVPYAIAAMAWAPPAFSKWVTPAFRYVHDLRGQFAICTRRRLTRVLGSQQSWQG